MALLQHLGYQEGVSPSLWSFLPFTTFTSGSYLYWKNHFREIGKSGNREIGKNGKWENGKVGKRGKWGKWGNGESVIQLSQALLASVLEVSGER